MKLSAKNDAAVGQMQGMSLINGHYSAARSAFHLPSRRVDKGLTREMAVLRG
jgi:hypothetical protein